MSSELSFTLREMSQRKRSIANNKSNLSLLSQFISHAEDNKRFPTDLVNWLSVHIPDTLLGSVAQIGQ